jgi:hypothetical protein
VDGLAGSETVLGAKLIASGYFRKEEDLVTSNDILMQEYDIEPHR